MASCGSWYLSHGAGPVPGNIIPFYMATSKIGGAFGYLRKSIGSVTYATIKDKNGKRVQVARQKIQEMTNPQTVGQILQRMKVKPAQRFYDAINSADGSLLLEHSWEGLKYGADGRRQFMSLAMKATGPYIPKNVNRFVPAAYQISAGSLPEVAITYTGDAFHFAVGLVPTAGTTFEKIVAALTAIAGSANSQLTFVGVTQELDGTFAPVLTRVIPSQLESEAGLPFEISGNDLINSNYVALAIILSRKDASGNWLRSNSTMLLTTALQSNLYGTAAQEAAIASYRDSSTVNNINSTWYLNLASGQPFNGQLSTYLTDITPALNGAVVGSIVDSYGDFIKVAFTVDGTAESPLIMVVGNQIVASLTLTGQDAIDEFASEVRKWQVNYAAQLGLSGGTAAITALYKVENDGTWHNWLDGSGELGGYLDIVQVTLPYADPSAQVIMLHRDSDELPFTTTDGLVFTWSPASDSEKYGNFTIKVNGLIVGEPRSVRP